MDHRLQSILDTLNAIRRQNLAYRLNSNKNVPKSKEEVEFYNDFRHVILPPYQHNEIEPIPNWNVSYGEREPYQEVKAHLISQNSNRISSSSKSVDDYRIENKGALSIDPLSLDKKYHDVREAYDLNKKENVPAAEQERIEKEIKEVKELVEIVLTSFQSSFSYYYQCLLNYYKEPMALWLTLIKFCSWIIRGDRELRAFELENGNFKELNGAIKQMTLNWFGKERVGDYWEGFVCSPLSEFQIGYLQTYVELKKD